MTEDTQIKSEQTGKAVKQSKLPLIFSGVLILALVLSYFIFPTFQNILQEGWQVLGSGNNKRISEWVSQFGFWGPFFIIFAMILQMFLIVVNVVALMLVAILAYGPFWGSVIAVVAVLTASTIGYVIGSGIGETGVRKIIGPKTEKKVSEFMDKYGVWAIIIARVSPFLSNDAVSFVAGFAGMKYLKFLSATFAGILPLTLLLAWLGEDFDRLKSGLIWISAIGFVVFIGYIVYDKYIANKN
jgi:uncharacterized membrane protein YdjX (TVP38/TMEM64 family)